MAYAYSEILDQARQWAQTAHHEGQLGADGVDLLNALDAGASEALFSANPGEQAGRPLIVAFMGGTGVGKSSLLNRLAGQPIARSGIERPTSREVTLYHHHSLLPQALPAGLPLDSIKLSQHHDDSHRHIVWIDMPDFDSVEQGNQRLVLEWLPHIDVLLYVVSPERYRDNKAWQLLLAEGAKHAWLFVMNQWDRGQPVQFDDFRQQLAKAGFGDPLMFRTSCSEPVGDEFAELVEQLNRLSGQHTIAQLQQRGEHWRRQQLHQALRQLDQQFSTQDYPQLQQFLQMRWPDFEAGMQSGLAWPMLQLAKVWAEHLGQKSDFKVWDDWAQNRLNDLLDELVLQADQCLIPGKPLKAALQTIRGQAEKNIGNQCELAGRQALLNPGNPAQRLLLRLTAIGETLLPLAAMVVVGYQVFAGYYHSTADATAYLGGDFAIHSVLLIALSWLIPFFLHKKLQPSLQKAAIQGLQKGLRQALAALQAEVKHSLLEQQRRSEALRRQLLELTGQCAIEPATTLDKAGVLARVLLD